MTEITNNTLNTLVAPAIFFLGFIALVSAIAMPIAWLTRPHIAFKQKHGWLSKTTITLACLSIPSTMLIGLVLGMPCALFPNSTTATSLPELGVMLTALYVPPILWLGGIALLAFKLATKNKASMAEGFQAYGILLFYSLASFGVIVLASTIIFGVIALIVMLIQKVAGPKSEVIIKTPNEGYKMSM